ncbi:MAG: sigma-70 family RNA polymerase sigma factor [Bacteroidota bacterium]
MERQLLSECQEKGSMDSYEKLYKHFFGFAMRVCYRYLKNEHEAMEVVNDSFLAIFKKIDSYDLSRPFEPWLRRILINNSINFIKKHSKHVLLETDDSESVHTDHAENDGLHDLAYHGLLDLIQQLSPTYRSVFNLYVIDGFTHEEISEKLGISMGSSKSNLSRARENLRQMLIKTSQETLNLGEL